MFSYSISQQIHRQANSCSHILSHKAIAIYLSMTMSKGKTFALLAEAAGQSHWDDDDARNFLNELCLEERIRLGGHPLINVNKNLKVESSTSQKSAHEIQHEHIDVDANQLDKHNKYDLSHLVHTPLMASKKIDLTQESSTSQISATETQDEYMEVIILAAIASKRDDEFPRIIKSWDDLKEALQLLTSEGSRSVVEAYVLFLDGQEKIVVQMNESLFT
ncbi:hypothetical protein ACLB2K_012433 [Fragaria x ananassa]